MSGGLRATIPATALLCTAFLSTAWCRGTGRLEGTVRDALGAVVPGTSVLCVGEETGFRFPAESGPDGSYALTVPAGHYHIIVRRAGFRPVARIAVLVPAGGTLRVDLELQPSSVSWTVTVSDVAETGGPASPAATLVHPDEVRALPRNDGAVTGLLSLVPGVLFTPASRGEAGQFSSLGARPNANAFSVDGAGANNAVSGAGWPDILAGEKLPSMTALGTTHDLASYDSILEVSVEPQGESAGIGQVSGASIVIHTRSGTDEVQGSIFGGTRPAALGANDWFANRYGLGHDAPNLNQAGGSFGGPLERDRTFVFVAAERLALRQGYAWTTTVPSMAARTLSPADLLTLLNEFPKPNGPDLNLGISELIGESRQPEALSAVSVRIDRQYSQAGRLFLRLADTPSWSESGITQTDLTQYRNQVAVLGTTLIHGRWTHDGRLSFGRNEATSTWSLPAGGEAPPPAFYSQYPSLAADFSNIVVGGAGSVSMGQNGRNLQSRWQGSLESVWQTARHEVRLGFEYLELQPERNGPGSSVTIAFGTPTNSFYGPLAPVWMTYSRPEANAILLRRLSGFAQDAWQVNSRLSVTVGLRVACPQAPGVAPASNLYQVDDPTSAVPAAPIAESQPLWQGNAVQLAPSLSAAWRLSERANTVLRASWAMFHDGESTAATDQLNGIPYQQMQTPQGSPVQSYTPSGLVLVQLGYGFSRNLRLPTYRRWNVQLQHQWQRDSVAVSYSGLSGTGELRRELAFNPAAAPGTGALIVAGSNGKSQYHGLNAVYRRTLANGLQANVTYSWSHSIDLGSSDSSVFFVSPLHSPALDRGNSDFDVRHVVNAAVTYSPMARPGRGIAGRLLSQWTFGAVATLRTGFPMDIQFSETEDGFAIANYQVGLVPGAPIWISSPSVPGGRALNPGQPYNGGLPNAFVYPVAGIQALGRNTIAGFGAWQTDATAGRTVWERDALRIGLRVDAYNAFNHAQFADPARYASNPMFGQSQSPLNLMFGGGSPNSGQSPAFLMGAPRSLQVSLRLSF